MVKKLNVGFAFKRTPLKPRTTVVVRRVIRHALVPTLIIERSLMLVLFHQNRKDPMREIQWFPNLGHNLCENDKQTIHDYI